MMNLESMLREMDSNIVKKDSSFWITIKREELKKSLSKLNKFGVYRISSITGVDTENGIEVIYNFWHEDGFVNIRLLLPKERPEAETITDIFPGANLFERELMEMLGVVVVHHPNPKKLSWR